MRLQWLPAALTIAPGGERADGEGTRLEAGAQGLLEALRLAPSDLVLDGDVRAPGRLVLRHQQAVEGLGEIVANGFERRAIDTKRRALPQIHDAGEPGRRRRGGGSGGEPRRQLALQARREMAKESEMGGNAVELGRIMIAPELLEPAVVAGGEEGGDDERSFATRICARREDERIQISTWAPSSTTRLGGSLKNSIALSALRSIQANNFSRQIAMPGVADVIRVWRARKKLVSIILN